MKRIIISFLLGLLLVGALQAVSQMTPDGVEYLYTENVMNWRSMGSNVNVEPNITVNIKLLTFWPQIVIDSLCQEADSTEDYVYIQYQSFDGAIYGGVTTPHQTVRYSPVQASLPKQAIAKRIKVSFAYETSHNWNQALYGIYIPAENQISIFEVFQYGNGFGGYEQCNNITFRHYFEECIPPETPKPPAPPKIPVVVERDTVKVYITVEVPGPPSPPVLIQSPCNPYWEWSGWAETAGTWLAKGLEAQYEHDQFVNYHANFNEQNSYDELLYIEAKHGTPKSKFVGTVYGGFIDRLAVSEFTMGHESACDKERFQTRLGLGMESRIYSIYERIYLNPYHTSGIDKERRTILYYPFFYGRLSYLFNDRNKSLRKELQRRNLPNNLRKDFKDNVTIYGDVGPNTELFGSGELDWGKYSLGFYSKIQPKLRIDWYSILNLEYSLYPKQRVIFDYNGTDIIKNKGVEVVKYVHSRLGPKLSKNAALFAMGQYIEDTMNQTAPELGNKSIYVRKDLGIGVTWDAGRLEYLLIVSHVWVENIHDNEGWSAKFSINF